MQNGRTAKCGLVLTMLISPGSITRMKSNYNTNGYTTVCVQKSQMTKQSYNNISMLIKSMALFWHKMPNCSILNNYNTFMSMFKCKKTIRFKLTWPMRAENVVEFVAKPIP